MTAPNPKHAEIMKHMLGMNTANRQDWGQRNYFASYEDGTDYAVLRAMEALGLVNQGVKSPSGMHYFHVTNAGMAALGYERARNGYLRKLAVAA